MKTAAQIVMGILLLALFGGIAFGAYTGFHGWIAWPPVWSVLATVGAMAVFPVGMAMATLGAIKVWQWPAAAAVATFVGIPVACALLVFALLVCIGPWWNRQIALARYRLSQRE